MDLYLIYIIHTILLSGRRKLKIFWEKVGGSEKIEKIGDFILKTGRILGASGRILGVAGIS